MILERSEKNIVLLFEFYIPFIFHFTYVHNKVR